MRALAAFIVFSFHFTHGRDGFPVPYDAAQSLFPLSLLDKGHTGVALFMTLSGYLFAKLLDGKTVRYGAFIWNRALRLLPLLVVVIVLVGVLQLASGRSLAGYAQLVAWGLVLPTLPNGGWSITAELHYYLILPLILWLLARSRLWPLAIVFAALVLRGLLYQMNGEVQSLAYWTIVGRIDQFALGMLAYHLRGPIAGRHALALGAIASLMLFYWHFDLPGGFTPATASPSPLWIFIPTLEGAVYAIAIAWYDGSFHPPATSRVSQFVSRVGEYSYSIYLLHFFLVFAAARFVHERIMDISSFHVALLWSIPFFLLMMLPGYVSYRFVEAPFLKLRKPYAKPRPLVLVADTRAAIGLLKPILRSFAHLEFAETYEAALKACQARTPAAIVVGYHFDGARPGRLISRVREGLGGSRIPLVLVRALALQPGSPDARTDAGRLDAKEFVDLFDDAHEHGRQAVLDALRAAAA